MPQSFNRRPRSPNSGHEINSPVRWRLVPSALALPRATKGTSVILVLNQYKCIGCSPRKHSDTRTMAIGSDDDSLDSVHDKCSCISVELSEQLRKCEGRDRNRRH